VAKAKTSLSKQVPLEYLQGVLSLRLTLTKPAAGEEWPMSVAGGFPGHSLFTAPLKEDFFTDRRFEVLTLMNFQVAVFYCNTM
jgi:hypothetical protein